MRYIKHYLFDRSYLEVFGVLTGVGVDVSKFFGVGAGALKPEAGAESDFEKCASAHLCLQPLTRCHDFRNHKQAQLSNKFDAFDLALKKKSSFLKDYAQALIITPFPLRKGKKLLWWLWITFNSRTRGNATKVS